LINETIEKKLSKLISHGFILGNGMLLTPDEIEIIENFRVIHTALN
jgi:hypothetical protein